MAYQKQIWENAILTLSGTFWNDNFGVVINTITSVTYKLKKSDSSTWITGTTTITLTTSDNTFTFTGQIASDNQDTTWDLDSSYNLEVIVSDELSSANVEFILNSAVPTLSLDKEGVGILCAYNSSLGGYLQVNGKVVGEDIYSTSEVKTNKVWINNEPIYRKVYTLNNWANDGIVHINHGVSNLKYVTNLNYSWYDTTDQRWFNNARNDSSTIYIRINSITSTQIVGVSRGVDWSSRTRDVIIVMEYTKTTN